ncbi:AraC family transcriptional regulator ligand-binding domain-containing protein [Nocardia sp. NPDC004123]
MPAILDGTGVDPAALANPDAEIQAGQELRMVRNIVAGVGDVPGIGLLAVSLALSAKSIVVGMGEVSVEPGKLIAGRLLCREI